MKLKSIKKSKKLFLSGLVVSIPFIASSCATSVSNIGVGVYNLFAHNNDLSDYIDDYPSAALKWISQRTLSLRFLLKDNATQNNVYIFGTAWIFAKDTNAANDYTYYLATNIHVINKLNQLNNNSDRYKIANDQIQKLDSYTFQNLSFSYLSDNQVASTIRDENNNLRYLWENNNQATDSYIKLTTTDENNNEIDYKPEIVYTATLDNLVNNSQNVFVNPYSKNQIANPAIDFAIIKVDFSNVLDKKPNYANAIDTKLFLLNYNNSPTYFSKDNMLDYSNSFYIGGFPEDYTNWKPNQSVTWLGLTNIKLSNENEYNGIEYEENSKYTAFEDPTSIMPEVGAIEYVENVGNTQYDWFKNVANQVIIPGASIGGGASGSMLVAQDANNNFKVVGIYWGAYYFTANSGITYNYAVADLLNSPQYFINTSQDAINLNYQYPAYNVVEEASQKLNIQVPVV